MSCPLQVLRKQLYNIYHRKIYAVVRSVHLGPTPKTAQTEGRSAPQDLSGLDLDADPRRKDPPNHLVATNNSPSCLDDRICFAGSRFSGHQVKVHEISRNWESLRLMFHIQTSCSGSHVRSTRVPSEKQTWQAGKNYIEVIEAISATNCCIFHWEMVPDFWTHIATNGQNACPPKIWRNHLWAGLNTVAHINMLLLHRNHLNTALKSSDTLRKHRRTYDKHTLNKVN